jgi:RNA polymerase sigma-70 factor (ECF subfamily)
VFALLALMLLHDSRRDARTRDGELVLLEEQDRSLWDRTAIEEGVDLLERSIRLKARHAPGVYQLQAAIAALHADADSPEATDWAEIADLYGALLLIHNTPVIRLNRAVAVAMASGPDAGLCLIGEVGTELDEFHPLHAARADLLRRGGRFAEAAAAYQRAITLCSNAVERRYLERRLAEIN